MIHSLPRKKVPMKSRIAFVLPTLLSLCASSAGAANILELYDYHGDEVTASAKQKWLGLYKVNNKQYVLKPVKVSITRVHDAIVDEDTKAKTGKRISVAGKEKPVFIFSGVSELKPGNVTASSVKKENLKPKDVLKAQIGDDTITWWVKGKEKQKEEYTNFSVTASNKRGSQTLVSVEHASLDHTPSLMWCGDLDGDGKLDMIMDTSTDYNMSKVTLFLSSKAKKGKLVGEAAVQVATGC